MKFLDEAKIYIKSGDGGATGNEGARPDNKVNVSDKKRVAKQAVQVRVHHTAADGSVLVCCDLGAAMAASDCISWHSSYPWTTLTCERRWGRSEVVCYNDSGLVDSGLLRSVISRVRRWADCRIYLLIVKRVQHVRLRLMCVLVRVVAL